MSYHQNHPLHPGNAVPTFISPGILKEPNQFEVFTEIEDPLVIPLLYAGGFTKPEWSGNAKPGQTDFVYYPERGMAGNARGLPNPGKEGILALGPVIAKMNELGIKSIIQVTNLPFERPIDVIPELVDIAASVNPTAVEVNLSCPNGKKPDGSFHPPLSSNAEACGEVMSVSRDVVGYNVVLGAKDSPHVSSLQDEINEQEIESLSFYLKGVIDFISGINTIGNQPFPEIECANGRGGMSGPIVAELAKSHIRLWEKYAPEIAYLSTGGVDSKNAHEEIIERLAFSNVIRVGGAQEFYRSPDPVNLALRWAQESI